MGKEERRWTKGGDDDDDDDNNHHRRTINFFGGVTYHCFSYDTHVYVLSEILYTITSYSRSTYIDPTEDLVCIFFPRKRFKAHT